MSVLKTAYVAAARKSMDIPMVAGFFDRTVQGGTGFRKWLASLTAIYQLDRMIRLDIPWWNVAATVEVEAFLEARPQARVFEYGSGASTAWLARRCGTIVSVEHDEGWRERVAAAVAPHENCTLVHMPLEAGDARYACAIAEAGGPFDLVVVDGRNRAECLRAAIGHLAPRGIILFDDSGRRRYRPAIADSALVETRHFGRSYCVPYPDYSSILRRAGDAQ